MSNTTIGGDFGINVTTLLLVEVNFCLENVNFLGLLLQSFPKLVFLLLQTLLFLFILVVEDLLVGAVQLLVQRKLLGSELFDKVKQIGVHLNGLGEFALRLSQLSLLLFLLQVALLFQLVEFVLQIEHHLTGSADLKRVQVDDVSESEHLSLLVFALSRLQVFSLLTDQLLLLLLLLVSDVLLLVQDLNLFLEFEFAVNKLQKLRAREQDRVIQILGETVATPVHSLD